VREPPDDRPLRGVWGLLTYLASRLRRRAATTAALWTSALALVALSAVVAADAALDLPTSALLFALAAGAAAVAMAAGLAYRSRPSTLYLARLVERQRPELKEALVTLVELAADASSDRSMQRALARRAGRILSRDPPHTFLPVISWRRPGWALAAGVVTLGAVLWLGHGTAGTVPAVARAARDGGAARSGAGGASSPGATGSPQHAPRKRDGEHATARAGGGEGSEAVARAEGEGVRRGVRAARDGAGDASGGEGSEDVARAEDARVRRGAGDVAVRADCGSSRSSQSAETQANPDEDARPLPRQARAQGEGGSGVGGAAGERSRPRERPSASPLPQRTPDEAAPENVLDAMRRRKPHIEDERAPDEAEVPRKFLGKMGVSPADDRRYTTAWSEGRQRPRPGPDAATSHRPARTVPGQVDGRVLEATGDAGARPVVVPADAGAGERGRLIHAAEVRVSPRLRPAVRAYFERIGRLASSE